MPHSFGYRARTRTLFQKSFGKHGMPSTSRYLQKFNIGDYVDIKADSAIHKGMPFRYYHGRTGRIWALFNHAVGIEVNKRWGNRIIQKRVYIRIEHVRKSKCRQDFLQRCKTHAPKRVPQGPRKGQIVHIRKNNITTLAPKPYKLIV
uniref:RPL21 n=1 Tax=Streblomastix strix TaxID=222440 RepID=Q1KYN7_9EUKA|nr:RPL21 [Streblomastix strix]